MGNAATWDPSPTKPDMNPTSEKRGIILMLLSIIFFTANTLLVRALALWMPECTGWQVTLFRGLTGTAIVVALYRKGGLRMRSLIDRPKIILRGILGASAIPLFYIAVIELGAARAIVINLTYPIFAALLAAIILKEELGMRKFCWILAGFAGLMIFLGPQAFATGLSVYDWMAIASSLIAAATVVVIRSLHRTEHGSTIFASQAVFCALLALPMTANEVIDVPVTGVIFLIIAGVLVAVGQLTMTFAYRHLDVSKGSSMQMLLPIFTAAGAWYLFDERLGWIEFLGAALTLTATVMVNRRASKSPLKMTTIQPTQS